MTLQQFNDYCAALPHARNVIQWGGSSVWKVGGKVFAIGARHDGAALGVTFKCSPMAFDLLKQRPGLRPAPYLASRGLSWLQRVGADSMNDDALRDYLLESHRLAALSLSKKARRELGLDFAAGRA